MARLYRDLHHSAAGKSDRLLAAERLERAVASDGPVDADLSTCFFASAEAALAVLSQTLTPSEEQTSAGGAEPGCRERRRRVRELEAMLEAGNTRALDHLPWLERWADTQGPGEARELLGQIEALDFPAALQILRGLGEGVFTNPPLSSADQTTPTLYVLFRGIDRERI